MTKTILIPLDGSALSERAVPYAQVLARTLAARIVLVRAVMTGPFSTGHEAAPAELDEAGSELARITAQLREAGIEVEAAVPNDEAGRAVIKAAQDTAADLIVMSTHGRSGLGRWVYGSVADRVLRKAAAPVLLIPPAANFDWSADPAAFRIVVPLDGSRFAEEGLAMASALARGGNGELMLVRALLPPYLSAHTGDVYIPVYLPQDALETREAVLESLAPVTVRLDEQGIPHSVYVNEGVPEDVILEVARDRHAHLIVMGTHGRGGLPRFLLGSVADAVLRRTHVTLLLVRPSALVDEKDQPTTLTART